MLSSTWALCGTAQEQELLPSASTAFESVEGPVTVDVFEPVLFLGLLSRRSSVGQGRDDETEPQVFRWIRQSLASLSGDLRLALDLDPVDELGRVQPLVREELARGRSTPERPGAAQELGRVTVRALQAAATGPEAPANATLALLHCAQNAPLSTLRRSCSLAMAGLDASAVVDRLERQLTGTPVDAEWSVVSLGALLLEGELGDVERRRVAELLTAQTRGMRKAVLGERAVEPLAIVRVDGIEKLLVSLSKGLKNLPIKDDALRARALHLQDPEAVEQLVKAARGRSLLNSTPDQRLSAGRTLLDLDHPAGWEWAERELQSSGKRQTGFAARSGLPSDDLRIAVADLLARKGDRRAIQVIAAAPVKRRDPVDPVEVWFALTLLELRAAGREGTVREYIDWFDWAFLAPRMAIALDRIGDRRGVAALDEAYSRSVKQSGRRVGSAILSAVAGSLDDHLDDRKAVKARAWLLKHELVAALDELSDGSSARAAETADLLRRISQDEDREVAASAVLALARHGQELPDRWTGVGDPDLFGRTTLALAARSLESTEPGTGVALLEKHATTTAHRALAQLWRGTGGTEVPSSSTESPSDPQPGPPAGTGGDR